MAVAVPVVLTHDGARKPAAKPSQPKGAATATEARRLARETGKEVEVTSEATAHTTTWAQPGGTFKLRVSSLAKRAKVGSEWKPIDTTLQRVEGGFAPRAINGKVVFSAGTKAQAPAGGDGRASRGGASRVALAQPALVQPAVAKAAQSAAVLPAVVKADTPQPAWTDLVRLNLDGHDLTVAWPGPLPEPVISGPRALYENIRPGIDLVLTAQDSGYTHVLVVKDKQAAADPLLGQLNYRLSSPDLTFHLDDASRSVSAQDAKGEEVAGSPTPFMWDSAGKVAVTEGEPVPAPAPEAKNHPTLALSGLNGAEGNHAVSAGASLSAENVLTVTPNSKLLQDADTVYPVFIDPSFKGHKWNWSLFYKTEGSSSFWNGQNYNSGSGTSEARVGYESTTGGTSRAAFVFELGSQLQGAQIRSANVRMLQTYSWGCDARAFDVYLVPLISSSSTWNNTNTAQFWSTRIGGASTGYGYNSSCPDAWVGVDIKSKVEEGARYGWGSITLGLRSPNEGDSSYWKKFQANGESAPYIEVEYTKVPDTPVLANMSTSPGGACVTGQPFTKIGKTDVDFRAKATDGDGNLRRLNFRIWAADGSGSVADELRDTNSDGAANVTIGWEKFTPGKTYYWLAQAIDWDGQWSGSGPLDSGGGGWCTFTVDHTQPTPPTIRSEDFPAPGPDGAEWSKNTLGPGKITVIAGGTNPADIAEFQWSLNHPTYDKKAAPAAGSDTVTVDVNPDNAGPNLFYVRVATKAGNLSNPVTYTFYVRPRPGLDGPGDVTGDGKADLLAVDGKGDLRVYPADATGDVDAWMPAATDNGKPAPAGYFKDALIGHSTDWYPGDGITDLIARMPDGKLYVYQGDGNGRFDISRRTEILLPAGAPDPATLSQIVVVQDVDGDKSEDIFATAGDTFWVLTGYSGASITEARQLSATSWTKRDIINIRDVTGDGVPDLVYRDDSTPDRGLALRRGKPGTNGGADINSLALAVNSADGKDLTYGTTGWDSTTWPLLRGTPDVNGDGIPDLYLTRNDGTLHLFYGGRTAIGNGWRVEEDDWNTARTLG
ncbi:DNRLRE domain-containing protein [Streptomyces sp. NPDC001591]|uniref:DNRLRE domain-containing protein n=1 Tax=Streptomyces sp. NPDC001591 TaxID=3364589 RepID=UPI0036BD3E9D